jgi:hypothetical protein
VETSFMISMYLLSQTLKVTPGLREVMLETVKGAKRTQLFAKRNVKIKRPVAARRRRWETAWCSLHMQESARSKAERAKQESINDRNQEWRHCDTYGSSVSRLIGPIS